MVDNLTIYPTLTWQPTGANSAPIAAYGLGLAGFAEYQFNLASTYLGNPIMPKGLTVDCINNPYGCGVDTGARQVSVPAYARLNVYIDPGVSSVKIVSPYGGSQSPSAGVTFWITKPADSISSPAGLSFVDNDQAFPNQLGNLIVSAHDSIATAGHFISLAPLCGIHGASNGYATYFVTECELRAMAANPAAPATAFLQLVDYDIANAVVKTVFAGGYFAVPAGSYATSDVVLLRRGLIQGSYTFGFYVAQAAANCYAFGFAAGGRTNFTG